MANDNSIYPTEKYTPAQISESANGILHPEARIGILLFNQHKYFEAHEALESAWRDETGPIREVYRGLLQIGVGYYHILRGNYSGATKMLARWKPWLEPFPAICRGIDLQKVKQDAIEIEKKLMSLGPTRISEFDRSMFEHIRFIESS